jgi:hypothetical protein
VSRPVHEQPNLVDSATDGARGPGKRVRALGAVAFALFLLKGIAWLSVPVLATCAGRS